MREYTALLVSSQIEMLSLPQVVTFHDLDQVPPQVSSSIMASLSLLHTLPLTSLRIVSKDFIWLKQLPHLTDLHVAKVAARVAGGGNLPQLKYLMIGGAGDLWPPAALASSLAAFMPFVSMIQLNGGEICLWLDHKALSQSLMVNCN